MSVHSVFAMLFENLFVTEYIMDFYFFERFPLRNQYHPVLSQKTKGFQQVPCCFGPCKSRSMANPSIKPYLGMNFYVIFFLYWELHFTRHNIRSMLPKYRYLPFLPAVIIAVMTSVSYFIGHFIKHDGTEGGERSPCSKQFMA